MAISRLLAAAASLWLGLFLWTTGPVLARQAADATIELAALPREGRLVHAAIRKGGPFRYDKDGTTFGNREGLLPRHPRGYYREFTVETPGARNRGARRIVCGGESADWARNAPAVCWYTEDHYASFRRIKD
jgi:ribonuclease T1